MFIHVCMYYLQYWGSWNNYNEAVNYACKEAKYRHRAIDIAQSEGLLSSGKNNRKKDKKSKVIFSYIRFYIYSYNLG